MHLLIEAEWHIYASVNQAIIGSENAWCLDRTKSLCEPMLEYY